MRCECGGFCGMAHAELGARIYSAKAHGAPKLRQVPCGVLIAVERPHNQLVTLDRGDGIYATRARASYRLCHLIVLVNVYGAWRIGPYYPARVKAGPPYPLNQGRSVCAVRSGAEQPPQQQSGGAANQ